MKGITRETLKKLEWLLNQEGFTAEEYDAIEYITWKVRYELEQRGKQEQPPE